MGLRVASINGFEGQVELAGNRAVAASFLRWNIKRREESGNEAWSLHAVLSYQKDSLLRHPKFKRRVMIKVQPGGTWYELKGEFSLEGDELRMEDAELCRADQTGRP